MHRQAALSAIFAIAAVSPATSQSQDFRSALPSRLASCAAVDETPRSDVAFDRQSTYVPMPDGVALALDILRPSDRLNDRLPTIFFATRYGRSLIGRDPSQEYRNWIARGYAVVVADVRGTGASFGTWFIPYSRQEVHDVGDIALWIAAQRWSNGRVAATGTSYPGTTALTASAFGSPAVKAIVPRFADFDMYSDLLFPGGATAEDLIITWGQAVRKMDLNENVPGVRPVDGPEGPRLLAAAVEQHRQNPWSFAHAAQDVTFRDEPLPRFAGMTIDEAGTFHLRGKIEASGVPIFGWASWMDSGTAQGLLNRFTDWDNPQVSIIGAWSHGAGYDSDPFRSSDHPIDVPRAMQEQLYSCFVAPFLAGETTVPEHMLIYYTMGEGRWKTTPTWPLPGTRMRKFYLGADGGLDTRRPTEERQDAYRVDFAASTGKRNRWATQAGGGDVVYADRLEADRRLLVYTSEPLEADTEVTGHGTLTLQLAASTSDGVVYGYLEDVSPDGRVTYVTEGELRMLHRKTGSEPSSYRSAYSRPTFRRDDASPMKPGVPEQLSFQFLPTSVLFRKGHRIRVAFAGADEGNFRRVPTEKTDVQWRVTRGGPSASFIELPIISR